MFLSHNKGFCFPITIAGANVQQQNPVVRFHPVFFLFSSPNRNPSPRFFSTSKEGSLTTLTAPSPQCPGPGGTARETHLMLRCATHTDACSHMIQKYFAKKKKFPSFLLR